MNRDSRAPETLYELLGVEPGATQAGIREAYERSVMRVQARVENCESGALDELRLLRDAFHILHDDERRQHYDAWVKPRLEDDGAKEKALESVSVAQEAITWGIVLLLVALALAGLWTYLSVLESAAENPVEFAATVRIERDRRQ